MRTLLQVQDLSKRFGRYQALADISFDIRRGEILGLIGPNGSGKTTFLECLAGLLPYEQGAFLFQDKALSINHRKDVMFYLPEAVTPYGEFFTAEVINIFGKLYGAAPARRDQIVDQLELGTALKTRVGALSKGFRRRLLLALALLSTQPLLVLDEPFEGLDLHQTRTVMSLLQDVRSAGRTLLLSIHQLTDAERICDRFLLLSAGRLLGAGTLDELRGRAGLAAGGIEEVFLALT